MIDYTENINQTSFTHIDQPIIPYGPMNSSIATWINYIYFTKVSPFGYGTDKTLGGTWCDVVEKLNFFITDLESRLSNIEVAIGNLTSDGLASITPNSGRFGNNTQQTYSTQSECYWKITDAYSANDTELPSNPFEIISNANIKGRQVTVAVKDFAEYPGWSKGILYWANEQTVVESNGTSFYWNYELPSTAIRQEIWRATLTAVFGLSANDPNPQDKSSIQLEKTWTNPWMDDGGSTNYNYYLTDNNNLMIDGGINYGAGTRSIKVKPIDPSNPGYGTLNIELKDNRCNNTIAKALRYSNTDQGSSTYNNYTLQIIIDGGTTISNGYSVSGMTYNVVQGETQIIDITPDNGYQAPYNINCIEIFNGEASCNIIAAGRISIKPNSNVSLKISCPSNQNTSTETCTLKFYTTSQSTPAVTISGSIGTQLSSSQQNQINNLLSDNQGWSTNPYATTYDTRIITTFSGNISYYRITTSVVPQYTVQLSFTNDAALIVNGNNTRTVYSGGTAQFTVSLQDGYELPSNFYVGNNVFVKSGNINNSTISSDGNNISINNVTSNMSIEITCDQTSSSGTSDHSNDLVIIVPHAIVINTPRIVQNTQGIQGISGEVTSTYVSFDPRSNNYTGSTSTLASSYDSNDDISYIYISDADVDRADEVGEKEYTVYIKSTTHPNRSINNNSLEYNHYGYVLVQDGSKYGPNDFISYEPQRFRPQDTYKYGAENAYGQYFTIAKITIKISTNNLIEFYDWYRGTAKVWTTNQRSNIVASIKQDIAGDTNISSKYNSIGIFRPYSWHVGYDFENKTSKGYGALLQGNYYSSVRKLFKQESTNNNYHIKGTTSYITINQLNKLGYLNNDNNITALSFLNGSIPEWERLCDDFADNSNGTVSENAYILVCPTSWNIYNNSNLKLSFNVKSKSNGAASTIEYTATGSNLIRNILKTYTYNNTVSTNTNSITDINDLVINTSIANSNNDGKGLQSIKLAIPNRFINNDDNLINDGNYPSKVDANIMTIPKENLYCTVQGDQSYYYKVTNEIYNSNENNAQYYPQFTAYVLTQSTVLKILGSNYELTGIEWVLA